MKKNEEVLITLTLLCAENEIFPADVNILDDDDLFDYGTLDSMTISILTFLIEENYNVKISPELFVAELRTPRLIADYIADNCAEVVHSL